MYLGRPVEHGPRDEIFAHPAAPLYARPPVGHADPRSARASSERIVLKGELPSPLDPPTGCTFHPRCPLAFERCPRRAAAAAAEPASLVACHAVNPDVPGSRPAFAARAA